MPTDIELSYRLLLSLHSIIAVSVYPSLVNSWINLKLLLAIPNVFGHESKYKNHGSIGISPGQIYLGLIEGWGICT